MYPGTQPQDGVLALLNGPCRLSLTEQAIQSSRMDTARLPPQWPKEQSSVGAGVDPTPRLECGRQNPESISSLKKKKKKIYTRMIALSLHCIINRSETSLYDFS